MYLTEQSKWVAFKFKDPFAADKFLVCNTTKGVCCRPNCDLGFTKFAKNEISFVDSIDEALLKNFKPCKYCLPDKQLNSDEIQDGSFVSIDLNLLVQTVEYVNEQIGTIKPLTDDGGAYLKESIWKTNNPNSKKKLSTGFANHSSTSSSSSSNSSKDLTMTRNEFDHLKLVDLACRHIALAALSTSFSASILDDSGQSCSTSNVSPSGSRKARVSIPQQPLRKKRRRGGVLGFKELAAKSNLSPWHFHRVFKSVTGLTPKTYGDKCWKFINKHDEIDPNSRSKAKSIIINTRIANPTLAIDEANAAAAVAAATTAPNQRSDSEASSPGQTGEVKQSSRGRKKGSKNRKESNTEDKVVFRPSFHLSNSEEDDTIGNKGDESPLRHNEDARSPLDVSSSPTSSPSSLFSTSNTLSMEPLGSGLPHFLRPSSTDGDEIFTKVSQPALDQPQHRQDQHPLLSTDPSHTTTDEFIDSLLQSENSFYPNNTSSFNLFDSLDDSLNLPSQLQDQQTLTPEQVIDTNYHYAPSSQFISNQQQQLQAQQSQLQKQRQFNFPDYPQPPHLMSQNTIDALNIGLNGSFYGADSMQLFGGTTGYTEQSQF